MKKTLAASLFALSLLVGCTGNAASSVPGTYVLDKAGIKDAMMASMPADEKAKPENAKMVEDMANGMNMSIELKSDNTAVMTAKMSVMGQTMDESGTGTWKLDGNKLTLTVKDKTGKEETKVADYASGSFSMEEDMGGKKMKMTFKKQ